MEPKKLYRSRVDRYLLGVCGGLGEYFNVDANLLRLAAVLFALLSCGTALIAYFVAAVIIPERP
ncbi:MAG TPA: PspC domain-containing protein [Candidatus Dorea intestinavium]|nr:PspC domain-containing protein [Candidatus Dorea intestinavium]